MRFALKFWSKAMVAGWVACLAFWAAMHGAHAQESDPNALFPTKPLQFIVPYSPGGPLDTMARLLADKVQSELGQTVVVENRPGAGGNIGAGIVARAKADGYTLVMGAVAINAINPWLYDNTPFDPIASFEPVALVALVPNVLVVNNEFAQANGIDSVENLIDYAADNPGALNFSSGGNGSAGHLAGELLNVRSGINTVHIPYQGAAPAQLGLLSGQVDFMFDNLAAAASLIAQNRVKALAVTTADRSSLLPQLPTMQQAGVDDFDLGTWFGVLATGGTPRPVVDRLNAAYVHALDDPGVRETLQIMGSEIRRTTPEGFAQLLLKDLAKYKDIVEISGAKLY